MSSRFVKSSAFCPRKGAQRGSLLAVIELTRSSGGVWLASTSSARHLSAARLAQSFDTESGQTVGSLASTPMPDDNNVGTSTSSRSRPLAAKESLPWRLHTTASMTSSRTARIRASRPVRGAGALLAAFGERERARTAEPAELRAKEPKDDAGPHGLDEALITTLDCLHAEPLRSSNYYCV